MIDLMRTENSSTPLKPSLNFLSHIMRMMPKNIRKTLWWWDKMYSKIGGGRFCADPEIDNQWPSGLQKPISSIYGYRLHLDLRNWADRRAYFSGTYYQTDILDLLSKIIHPSDQFVDIGANVGFITLHAAQLVGPHGRVVACEPNPAMLFRLHDHIKINAFEGRVTVVESAFGEVASTAILHVPENHPGMATFTSDEGVSVEVPVAKGDDALFMISKATPLIIKIDVEGFEQKTLSGLMETLEHPEIILVIEVTDHMLKRVGDSAVGIYEFLKAKGFEGFLFKSEQKRFNTELNISSCNETEEVEQYDAVFAKSKSKIINRLLK
jgi:FkbM family methyltransferase